MAKDLNKVMIIGRLGTDPEMRYTASGNPVTTFRVAASRQWKDSSGEFREETEWFSIVTWNKLAEICHQHLNKNMRVYLEGRLQTRSWEDQQSGQTRYKTEVVANDMIILDTRDIRGPREVGSGHNSTEEGELAPPGVASRSVYRNDESNEGYLPPLDIGDEDIPF
jgi:single-strand DNA-binding protein